MKGFMRFKSETKITFNKGINVIYGNNGAGKTSIVDAIFFCLYGKTTRTSGTGASGFLSLKDLINREANEAEVMVSFTLNNKEYIVTRKVSKSSNSIASLQFDGEQIAEGKHVADYIENNILGLGYDGLKNSIMIVQDEMQNYIDMQSTERKNTLTNLFKINEYDGYNATLGKLIKNIEISIAESKSKISYIENIISKEDELKEELNSHKKITKISKETLNNKKESINNNKKEIDNIKNKINDITTEIKLSNQKIYSLKNEITLMNSNSNKLTGKSVCPLCFQSIENNDSIISHYANEIAKNENEIRKIEAELKDNNNKINELISNKIKLESEVSNIEAEIKEMEDKGKNEEAKEISLNDKLQEIKNLKQEKKKEEEELAKKLKKEENSYILKDAYDKIPKIILGRVLPSIEKEATKIIDIISNSFITQIKIDQNTFRIQPFINGKFEEIQFLSAGEKVRVAIAVRIAISNVISRLSALATIKNFNGIKTLIIDEGDFGSLDDDGINNIITILNNLKEMFEKIVLITHISALKESISDNLINVSKTEKYESKALVSKEE